MNTIEQAREVSLRICIAGYFDESETIDALITDLNEWRDEALSAQERFKAAEDKLANIKGQKPVGVVVRVDSAMAPGCSYLQGTMIKNTPDGALLYLAAGAQSIPAGYQLVPMEPTTAMVSAYLEANKAYWERTDELPKPPHKWRLGTPFDATINSYKAMLAAAPVQAGAQPAPKQEPVMQHCPNCNHEQMALSVDCGNCGNVYDAAPVQAQERKPFGYYDPSTKQFAIDKDELPRGAVVWPVYREQP